MHLGITGSPRTAPTTTSTTTKATRTQRTNISSGAIDLYTWDYRDRLTRVISKTSGGTVTQDVSYTYDVNNNRIGKQITVGTALTERYIYAAGQLVQLPRWQQWAKAAKKKLDEMMGAAQGVG